MTQLRLSCLKTSATVILGLLISVVVCGDACGAGSASAMQGQPCIAVSVVEVSGPASGTAGAPCAFSAIVIPAEASAPMTYTWQASGQPAAVTHSDRGTQDSIELTWSDGGTYVVVVTAGNDCGVATSRSLTVTIAAPVPVCNALEGITIEAPETCGPATPCTLKATASPSNASTPIMYSWSASGQPTVVVHTSKSTADSMTFAWGGPGRQTISVVATNECGGSVSAVHSLEVREAPPPCSPLSEINISAPASATVGTPCALTATAGPGTATTPIRFVWNWTGQPVPIEHVIHGTTDTVELVWSSPGGYAVTVSAVNDCGVMVNRTHTIAVKPAAVRCRALTALALSGPRIGSTGTPYAFDVVATPVDASIPIDYSWKADGQTSTLGHAGTTITDTVSYSWNQPGTYAVEASADNSCKNPVRATHQITIETGACVPLTGLSISGPQRGDTGVSYEYVVSAAPVNSATPIRYEWKCLPRGNTLLHPEGGLVDTRTMKWSDPGFYTLIVTAKNECGEEVTQSYKVVIRRKPSGTRG